MKLKDEVSKLLNKYKMSLHSDLPNAIETLCAAEMIGFAEWVSRTNWYRALDGKWRNKRSDKVLTTAELLTAYKNR